MSGLVSVLKVETFKTDVIVFIGNVIMSLTSYRAIISCIRVSSMILRISLDWFIDKISKLLITDRMG